MKRGGDAHRDPSTHTHTADAALNLNWLQSGEWVWSQEPESKPLLTQRKTSLGSQRREGMLYEPGKLKQAFSTTATTGS